MNKKSPKIRFKGFTDDWEQRKFSNIVNRVSKQSNDSNLPKVEFEDIVSGEGRLNKDISRKFDDRKGIVFEPNFILFGKLRPYLKNWLFPNFKGIALGDFWVFEPNDSSSIFNYYLIQSNKYQTVANLSSGTKMPRSDWKTVSETEFSIPVNIEEQTKIGSFFKQLDNTITLHQDAIQHQQDLKKAMLQKLFPVNGARIPTVRFATFKEEWEQRKLGEITESYSGGTPSVANHSYYGGSIPFIRSAEINSINTELYLTEEGLNSSSAKLVEEGDILYALYGATSGEVGISQINGAINQAILAIKPKSKYDPNFIMQWLRRQKNSIISTYLQGGQGNLSGAIVKDLILSVPIEYDEQIRIGAFFKQLDNTIALHQDAIHKLQLLKQSLLQKIFVN